MANFTFKSTVSIGQLFVVDAGNFDVNIDAVQQRAADFLLVRAMAMTVQLHSLTGSL
jgi:hypothetical protein